MFKQPIREMSGGGRIEVTPSDLRGYQHGDAGWVADRPTFRPPDGAELPLRITAVFVRESGEWRCVQWHASLGVANEEAVGRELTV